MRQILFVLLAIAMLSLIGCGTTNTPVTTTPLNSDSNVTTYSGANQNSGNNPVGKIEFGVKLHEAESSVAKTVFGGGSSSGGGGGAGSTDTAATTTEALDSLLRYEVTHLEVELFTTADTSIPTYSFFIPLLDGSANVRLTDITVGDYRLAIKAMMNGFAIYSRSTEISVRPGINQLERLTLDLTPISMPVTILNLPKDLGEGSTKLEVFSGAELTSTNYCQTRINELGTQSAFAMISTDPPTTGIAWTVNNLTGNQPVNNLIQAIKNGTILIVASGEINIEVGIAKISNLFSAPTDNFPLGISNDSKSLPVAVKVMDIDNDGQLEIIVLTRKYTYPAMDNKILVLKKHKGYNSFYVAEDISLPLNITPTDLAIGDLNGDNVPDFAIASYEQNMLIMSGSDRKTISINMPHWVNSPPMIAIGNKTLASVGGWNNFIEFRTFDKDFNSDVTTGTLPGNFFADNLQWSASMQTFALNTVNLGHFLLDQHIYTQFNNGAVNQVAYGDVNGDGDTEFVYSTKFDGIYVANSKSNGKIPNSGLNYGWRAVSAIDANGDGRLDIVAFKEGSVSVWLQKADGWLRAEQSYPIYGNNAGNNSVAFGDLNSDGKTDIVTLDVTKGVSILFSQP